MPPKFQFKKASKFSHNIGKYSIKWLILWSWHNFLKQIAVFLNFLRIDEIMFLYKVILGI